MNNSDNNTKLTSIRVLVVLGLLVLILAGGQLVIQAITGGASVATPQGAQPIVGQAAQPLIDKNSANSTQDTAAYSLQHIVYFDNNTWLVAKLTTQNSKANEGSVVMQKVGAFYQPVLGPGTNFQANSVNGMPADVAQYLNSKGLVYNAD